MSGQTQGLGMSLIAIGMESLLCVCPHHPGDLRQRWKSHSPVQRTGDQRGKAIGPWPHSRKRLNRDVNPGYLVP